MLNRIRKIFLFMESIVEWFEKSNISNIKLYYSVFKFILILSIGVAYITKLYYLIVAIPGVYLGFLILLQYLIKDGSKKKDKAGLKLIKEFSYQSFKDGLFNFSVNLLAFIFVILIFGVYIFTGNFDYSVKIVFYHIIEIFACILATFIVLWFSYHVVINDKVTPKEAKTLLTLCLWISATSLFFANIFSTDNIIKIPILFFGFSFSGVTHIISLREYELELEDKAKKDREEKEKQEELALQFWQETAYDLLMKKRD